MLSSKLEAERRAWDLCNQHYDYCCRVLSTWEAVQAKGHSGATAALPLSMTTTQPQRKARSVDAFKKCASDPLGFRNWSLVLDRADSEDQEDTRLAMVR